MTPLKPEEIQAALDSLEKIERKLYCVATTEVHLANASEQIHGSRIRSTKSATHDLLDAIENIRRALAFTLAANGEPTSEMREGCLSVIDCNKLSIERRLQNINDCYQKMIAKIWEEIDDHR